MRKNNLLEMIEEKEKIVKEINEKLVSPFLKMFDTAMKFASKSNNYFKLISFLPSANPKYLIINFLMISFNDGLQNEDFAIENSENLLLDKSNLKDVQQAWIFLPIHILEKDDPILLGKTISNVYEKIDNGGYEEFIMKMMEDSTGEYFLPKTHEDAITDNIIGLDFTEK